MALGQAVEKACGKGRQKPPVPDEDDVRHRGFGDMACHIQHEGIVMSATSGRGPRQGSGHVEPRAFRRRRRRIGRGAPPIRENQAQSAGPVSKGGLHWPVPGRDGGMEPAPLCRNGDAFAAAPGDRRNPAIRQPKARPRLWPEDHRPAMAACSREVRPSAAGTGNAPCPETGGRHRRGYLRRPRRCSAESASEHAASPHRTAEASRRTRRDSPYRRAGPSRLRSAFGISQFADGGPIFRLKSGAGE